MLAEPECVACIFSKQEKRCKNENKTARFNYLNDVMRLLLNYGSLESSPQLCERIDRLYERNFKLEDLREVKRKYNSFMFNRSDKIKSEIENSEDSLALAVKYACLGNYIDFHSVKVAEDELNRLLGVAENQALDSDELKKFKCDIKKARSLIYLTDNCGEIVLDKLLADALKKYNPDLNVTVMVRGAEVSNDATLEDAEQVGFTTDYNCVTNGSTIGGIVPDILDDYLKLLLKNADVIISKGQGNFEGMYGSGLNTYYMFLCKCALFTERFGVNRYTPVFAKECRLKF